MIDQTQVLTQKKRMFQKPTTQEGANKVLVHCSNVLYILAAIQVLFGLKTTSYASFVIAALFVLIAFFLGKYKSHNAAIGLLVFSILNMIGNLYLFATTYQIGGLVIGVAFIIMGIQAFYASNGYEKLLVK